MRRIGLVFCLFLAACSQSGATVPAASTSKIAPQPAAPAIASAPKRATAPAATTTDREIARLLVARSIEAYPGSCPCPENLDRAGRRCGKRSAYSRPGGYAPLCYESDVSASVIAEHRLKMTAAQ